MCYNFFLHRLEVLEREVVPQQREAHLLLLQQVRAHAVLERRHVRQQAAQRRRGGVRTAGSGGRRQRRDAAPALVQQLNQLLQGNATASSARVLTWLHAC
jgi:hypothetical protein